MASHLRAKALLSVSLESVVAESCNLSHALLSTVPSCGSESDLLDLEKESGSALNVVSEPIQTSPTKSGSAFLSSLRGSPSKLPSLATISPPKKSSFPMFSFRSMQTPSPSLTHTTSSLMQTFKRDSATALVPMPLIMAGRESGRLLDTTRKIDHQGRKRADDPIYESLSMALKFQSIFCLFSNFSGASELWEAVVQILGDKMPVVYSEIAALKQCAIYYGGQTRLIFAKDIILKAKSEARKIESGKGMRGSGSTFSVRQIERLREAAMTHARLGDMERYCSIMVDIGEWTTAIAMAPTVSMEYWQSLCTLYAASLAADAKEECVPYFIGTGGVEMAVDYYISRHDVKNSLLVAKAFEASQPAASRLPAASLKESSTNVSAKSALFRKVVNNMVRKEFDIGNGVLGAAQCLACTGDIDAAISMLRCCFEYEAAFALARCFLRENLIKEVGEELAIRCADAGWVEIALDLLDSIDATTVQKGLLLSYACQSSETAALIAKEKSLPSALEWIERVNEIENEDSLEIGISYLVCGRGYDEAVALAIPYLQIQLRAAHETKTSLQTLAIVNALKHMPASRLESANKNQLLCFLFWFSSFQAAREGCYETAFSVMRILRAFVSSASFSLSSTDILFQEILFRVAGGDQNIKPVLEYALHLDVLKNNPRVHFAATVLPNTIVTTVFVTLEIIVVPGVNMRNFRSGRTVLYFGWTAWG